MSISTDDLGRITQQTSVVSSDGDRLGTIDQIYTSDSTGEPAWVTLKTGLFGTQESFVPLADASFDGDDIRVPVTKKAVHDAPRVDADGHLSVEEEDDLYRYYGLHNPGGQDGRDASDERETHGGHAAEVGAGAAGAAAAVTGRDRDDELAQRDVEGRDEVADERSVHAEDGTEQASGPEQTSATGSTDDDVRPGERTTQLRRYVVTERVVRTVEELPDEPSR
ncbi:hypothetical protein GCM10022197_25250 [Microlunatus spumicola]|uniref:PRC-barrel domain-containing protein n=1 Tax=Microlunatus spumicola TaxID=81499 RepID=A0ABP6XL45_9ACTN